MQLWKKNFLFTFFLIQSLMFLAVITFISYTFHQSFLEEARLFKSLTSDSAFLIDKIMEESSSGLAREFTLRTNNQRDFHFKVTVNDAPLFSSIVQSSSTSKIEAASQQYEQLQLYREGIQRFLYFRSELELPAGTASVFYLKDISGIYAEQIQRMVYGLVFGLLFSGSVSLVMYRQMKKIYRPVENLAHELRTPLTLISGYSELLLRMKTSEEEKVNMGQEIFHEALHLQEVVEQLLIMGDLKDGEMRKNALHLSALFQKLEATYGEALVLSVHEEQAIIGNEVLLLRLCDNLLSNAQRVSQKIQVIIRGKSIQVVNDGGSIAEKTLKKMNRGKKLSPAEYQGSGQGFLICREIVLLHGGDIRILSREDTVEVRVTFP